MKHEVQKLLDQYNEAIAEGKVLRKQCDDIDAKLKDLGIKTTNVGIAEAIGKLEKKQKRLEKKINKAIEEVQNELASFADNS